MRQEWSPPAPGCVKNASRMVPQPPGCVKSASRMVPPAPGCVKNASRMVPPAPECENCDKTGPPVVSQFHATRVVRKLQQHWSTSVAAIFARAKTATRLVHQCCRNFRAKFARKLRQDWSTSVSQFSRKPGLCENCDKTGPPVLSQFSRKMDHCCCSFRHMGGQCCCNFRTCEKCNNTGPPMCENCNNTGPFCAKIATTLVQMREKCNNTGSICAKTVSTPVPHARKVQQHWGQNVRKVCQSLNTIGIYGLGFRVRV